MRDDKTIFVVQTNGRLDLSICIGFMHVDDLNVMGDDGGRQMFDSLCFPSIDVRNFMCSIDSFWHILAFTLCWLVLCCVLCCLV